MSRHGAGSSAPRDAGSAIVEFVLVSVLVIVIALGVVQLALALHVRTVLIDSAAEGARYAARAGHEPADGVARARELITGVLPDRYAAQVESGYTTLDEGAGTGRRVIRVRVQAPLPLFGLVGPAVVDVSGRAVAE